MNYPFISNETKSKFKEQVGPMGPIVTAAKRELRDGL